MSEGVPTHIVHLDRGKHGKHARENIRQEGHHAHGIRDGLQKKVCEEHDYQSGEGNKKRRGKSTDGYEIKDHYESK